MPHTMPSALQTKLESSAFQIAHLVKLERPDGETISLTLWQTDLDVDLDGDGSLTYQAVSLADMSTYAEQANTPIDDSELRLVLGDEVVADDFRRGLYAGTLVKMGFVAVDDLANPFMHHVYKVGEVTIDGLSAAVELLGLERGLETPVGLQITANCQAEFGDAHCGMNTNVDQWEADTVYAARAEIQPTAGGKLWFRTVDGGTSDSLEPTWTAGTVVDGDVEWTSMNARTVVGTVTDVTDTRTFEASGIDIANDYFGNGMIHWLTGDNTGDKRRVKSDDGAGNIVTNFHQFNTILVGDTFEITVGCWKRFLEDCVTKHVNQDRSSTGTLRFRGFPHLAPENSTITAPAGEEGG
jgi:hypothetical protein